MLVNLKVAIKCCGCECDRDPTLAADKAKLAGKGGDDKP